MHSHWAFAAAASAHQFPMGFFIVRFFLPHLFAAQLRQPKNFASSRWILLPSYFRPVVSHQNGEIFRPFLMHRFMILKLQHFSQRKFSENLKCQHDFGVSWIFDFRHRIYVKVTRVTYLQPFGGIEYSVSERGELLQLAKVKSRGYFYFVGTSNREKEFLINFNMICSVGSLISHFICLFIVHSYLFFNQSRD